MTKAPACPDPEVLLRLALGQMPPAEVERWAEHCEQCEQCVRTLQTLKPADTLIEVMSTEAPDSNGPEAVAVDALMERLAAMRPSVATTGTTQALHALLTPPQAAGELGRLGPYRVLEVLGSGGMGVVFRAEDPVLQRLVALKAMRPGLGADAEVRQRFLGEARAMAAVKHDHVITIYQVGQDRDVPYLAMELLEGESLEDRLTREGCMPVPDVLRIGREIAEGLAAAHQRGLIHRDIKPANVWLEASPGRKPGEDRVKILDFGLARAGARQGNLTQSGVILGTPAYMAPEQARGEAVDARCDLFSLGCVLYRACTGQLPFRGNDAMAIIASLALDQPVPVRQLNPAIPQPLADLVMRLLAKKPADRPASAHAVAETLREIEQPRPAAPRVPRRHWLVATAAALLVLIGGAFAAYQLVFKTTDGNLIVEVDGDADVRFQKGELRIYDSDGKQKYTLKPSQKNRTLPPGEYLVEIAGADGLKVDAKKFEIVRGGKTTVRVTLDAPADDLTLLQGEWEVWAEEFKGAPIGDEQIREMGKTISFAQERMTIHRTLKDGQRRKTEGTIRLDPRANPKTWDFSGVHYEGNRAEFRGLYELNGASLRLVYNIGASGEGDPTRPAEFRTSPNTSTLIIQARRRIQQPTQRPPATLTWTAPADSLCREDIPPYELAAAGDGDPKQATPELVAVLGDSRLKHWNTLSDVVLSRDGKLLASGGQDGTVRLWDPTTGQALRSFHGHTVQWLQCVTISPDDQTLATGAAGGDNRVLVWEASGKQRFALQGHTSDVYAVAFSPDGKTLASGSRDTTIRLWDPATGQAQRTLKGHTREVSSVAFSPDSKTLASAGYDRTVKLWDPATGELRQTLEGHTSAVSAVAFSADNTLLASACGAWGAAGEIRLWSRATGKNIATLGSGQSLLSVAFGPDGKTLASGEASSVVRLWDVDSGRERRQLLGHTGWIESLAFDEKGTTLVSGGMQDGRVKVWDVATGQEQLTTTGHGAGVTAVAVSPDGRTLASYGFDKTVRLWDLATGKERPTPARVGGLGPPGMDVCFSPDGRTIAAAGIGVVHLWESTSGRLRRSLSKTATGHQYSRMAFSPDGQTLATPGADGAVRLWDLATGEVRQTLRAHQGWVNCVAFSPDGQALATGGEDKALRLWDLATGKERGKQEYGQPVLSVAFRPDGQTVAACVNYHSAVDLWDVAARKVRHTLRMQDRSYDCYSASFSPDGQTVAVSSWGAEVTLWDVREGKLLKTYRLQPKPWGVVHQVAFTPDGRHLATANGNGTVYILRLAPPPTAK